MMSNLSRLLKESWSLVEDQRDELTQYFYARLFLADPQLRDLFPLQMDEQRARLLGALVTAVQSFDDVARLDEYLAGLGRAHRRFGVGAEHYGLFGEVLLESLRAFAENWCEEYDRAWREAYAVIAQKMIAAAEADDGPAFWYATVLTHERRGPDIAVFTCKPLEPFEYRAGQYVSVECAHQPRVWRNYSIANAPNPDGTLEFHVRAVPGGLVSGALVRRLQPGDLIRLGPPTGSMTLNLKSTRDIVCVAGGTGLAPIKALVEELTRYNRTRWVHLLVGARHRDDLYDLAALNRMASRHPWLSVVPACSEDPTFRGEQGTIDEVLARNAPWGEREFFVSGPPAMVRATLRTLADLSVPVQRIKYDPVPEDDPLPLAAHPTATIPA
jgi:NAD(P)H-flavin reductase/hemoglobin-like flavoprotein